MVPFFFIITLDFNVSPSHERGRIDLEWKIVYVGSAEDEQYDQVLDCILVGPVPIGINKFVYQVISLHFTKLSSKIFL